MYKFIVVLLTVFCSQFLASEASVTLDPNDPRWKWMDEQIDQEFKPFERKGITKKLLDATIKKIPEISFGNALKRYQIINRQVIGPDGEAKDLLKRIIDLYHVPNVDIIVHLQDIIWEPKTLPGPVLATCKIKNSSEMMIHFPVQSWAEWANNFSKIIPPLSDNFSWEMKSGKVFWRGWCNDGDNYNDPNLWTLRPRGKLCYLSQHHPESIDAAFSGNHPWMLKTEIIDEFYRFFPKKMSTWDDYLSHKYLIDLDGYVASTPGCAWKLLSNSAVFKHASPFTLWYYTAIKPWVHFIPLQHDISDLLEKIEWARSHDAEAHQIAENGRRFILENAMPEHLYLYCYKVLVKYASLQRYQPSDTSSTPSSSSKKKSKHKSHKKYR